MPYEVFRKSAAGEITDHYHCKTLRAASMWAAKLDALIQPWELVVIFCVPEPPISLPDEPPHAEKVTAWVANAKKSFEDFEEREGYRGADAD